MYKLLHIAAHYGGGVGTVLKSWIKNDTENTHTLAYLNDVEENKHGIGTLFNTDMVKDHDIVLCHVWNHPALYDFLLHTEMPPCRMIGWSHMSGLFPPYVLSSKLINYFDEFYYTSPVSNFSGHYHDTVWSCCDIKDFLAITPKSHDGFNIGYIGTLDYCKLHPQFVDICYEISQELENIHFTVIGGGCDEENIKKEVQDMELSDLFTFTGKIKDVKPYLAEFDVFLYPLNEKHFGTCEQVIGEAMAAGVPCAVFDNPAERCIIDGYNGYICRNITDMVQIVEKIYFEKKNNFIDEKKIKLYKNSAEKIYSIEKKIKSWKKIFDGVMQYDKKYRSWNQEHHIFIESLGIYGQPFINNNHEQIKEMYSQSLQWYSKSKGSIIQYADYFKDDKQLQEWRNLL